MAELSEKAQQKRKENFNENAVKKPRSDAAQAAKESIRDALHTKYNARDLLVTMKDGSAVLLNSDESFWTALQTLLEVKISSAPVRDQESGKWVGFVDTLDLVAATVELLEGSELFQQGHDADSDEAIEDLEGMLGFGNIAVRSVADFSQADTFVCLNDDEPAVRVAEALRKPHQHRVAVLHAADGRGLGVVSQSGLVEYLMSEYPEEISTLGVTVGDLDLPAQVLSVNENTRALDALKLLKEKRVGAVAVLDDEGRLVDVFSASDLMLWSEWVLGGTTLRFSNLSAMQNTVKTYLSTSRAQRDLGLTATAQPPRSPITCVPSDGIDKVTDDMLVNNVHRVFVVDSAGKPQSVVSYSDILSALLRKTGVVESAQ